MSVGQQAPVSELQPAIDRELADVTELLKARGDLDSDQLDAPAPVDGDTTEPADKLNSPQNSRESTPEGSGGFSSALSDLSRHSATSKHLPICGEWNGAHAALSGNVGRLLISVKSFDSAVTDPGQSQAAVQKQQQLMHWLLVDFLPLLRGFADNTLAFKDNNVPAACGVAQQLVNAHVALMVLDPPAVARCYGERSVQILMYTFTSEYLSREGVHLADDFAVSSTG